MTDLTLERKWIELKHREDELKKARLEVEAAIIDSNELKSEGANNIKEMITITTGYNRKFDQKGLEKLQKEGLNPFPFDVVFKENRADAKALEKMAKPFWDTHFEPLLTVSPKKPSFKVR